MPLNKYLSLWLLWGLLLFAFYGVMRVSVDNYLGNACPQLFVVPACYVVAIAYGLMLAALLSPSRTIKKSLFVTSWLVAFAIALFASAAELFGEGKVCPPGVGEAAIPLCYVSLIILIVVLVLFYSATRKETNNAR